MVESMGRVDKGEGWGAPLHPTAWALAWPWPGRGLRVVGSAAWGARSRRPGHVQLDGASPCFSDASTWLLVEAPAPLMTVPGGGVPVRQHTRQGQMLPDRFLRWSRHLPSGQQCGSGARLHAVLSQGAAGGPMPGLWFGLHAPRVHGQAGRFPSVCSQLRSAFLVGPSVSATRWVPDVFWTRGLVGPRWALPPVGFAFSTLSLERRCSVMMPPGCRLHPAQGTRSVRGLLHAPRSACRALRVFWTFAFQFGACLNDSSRAVRWGCVSRLRRLCQITSRRGCASCL